MSEISTKKYAARLVGFNNDSSTTFSDVQRFFRALEDRLARSLLAEALARVKGK